MTNLGLYRFLAEALRQARARVDKEHESFLEQKMLLLWGVLTEDERKEYERANHQGLHART